MVKVLWTSESRKWLGEIFDYIAYDSPGNAKEVIYNIIERADVLRDFPSIGQRLLDWPDYEIRMILYGHYRIVYRIISEQRIDILGVYHNALDLKRHLKI
ncbi:MAG: type II toxin-antitoxin system RelE/ParE family toxin [Spirochaetota bacterium]|nr:type II toxin-antitoxin system RelE/ParE family toxin [Spirochaetota bacterium]